MIKKISSWNLNAYSYQGYLDNKYVNELAEAIKTNGFTSTLLLVDEDGSFYLVTGNHRYAALKKLEREGIEVEVSYIDVTDIVCSYCDKENVTIDEISFDEYNMPEIFEGYNLEEYF